MGHDSQQEGGAASAAEAGTDSRYRRFLSSAPIAIAVHRDGELLYVNPAAADLVGADHPDELVGTSIFRFLPQAQHEAARERIRRIRAGKGPVGEVEVPIRRLDGDRRYAALTAVAVSVGGEPAVQVSLRDVTEKRQAEAALQESRQRYRSLFRFNPDAVYSFDLEGNFRTANPACERISGYAVEELLAMRFDPLIVPEHREETRRRFRRAAEGEPQNYETAIYHADGHRVDLHVTNMPIVVDDEIIGVYGVAKDITRQKRMQRALRESEERYRTLFEDSRDAVYVTTRDGEIVGMNPAGLELLGFEEEEQIRGVNARDLYVDPEQRDRFQRVIAEQGSVEGFEVQLRRTDGQVLDCLLTSSVRLDDDGEVVGYHGIIRDITERKRFEEQLERRALYDQLTDLPNRNLFRDRLSHALARSARDDEATVAVLFVDLDRFKVINDSLGHAAGDQLLLSVARRIRHGLRAEDTVARFGGDEFTVLLEEAEGPEDATEAAERLCAAFEAPFTVGGDDFPLTASIGIALGDGSRGEPDDLVRRADIAMYRAKEKGGTAYELFDPAVDTEQARRLERERALQQALEAGEFELHYQPIVDLQTRAVTGVEPLARWSRQEEGRVGPDDFIPLAEETGLIVPLGEHLLRRACRTFRRWIDEGLLPSGFQLHPNVSPQEMEDPGFLDRVRRVLEEERVDPVRVEFEMTEGLVMQAPDRVDELKRLGASVAVDDFGTGYSSLAYLKRLNVDTLKVDRSFVRGLGRDREDDAIVSAVVTLSETLGLDVVAEGVEEEEQVQSLRAVGCGFAQGFYFARPLPPEEFRRLLADGDPFPTEAARRGQA